MLVAMWLACGRQAAPPPDPGQDIAPLQGAWPRPARRSGVCAGSRGFEVARDQSPTGFSLIDRTVDPEKTFRILSASRRGDGVLALALQRDGHPERRLDVAVDGATGRATVTWVDPSRAPFVLLTPDAAARQPVKPCPP